MMLRNRGTPTTRVASWATTDRSTAYYRPHPSGPRCRADESRVRAQLCQMACVRPTCGHRRVGAMLGRTGLSINRKPVRRLMAVEGLLRPAHFHRPRLSPTGRLSDERSNETGYTKLPEIDTTHFGPCARMASLDAWTREVVRWELFPNCDATGPLGGRGRSGEAVPEGPPGE